MIEPIRPHEVEDTAIKPDDVIQVFNELIKKYWDGTQAIFEQVEAARLIAERMNVEQKVLFENKHLDIEYVYRRAGWVVEYDKPGYNESYSPTFTFYIGDQ